MTARELYDCDPGFRGFLAVWDAERRCPLQLVDYLLDRGMECQAEAARWAAVTEKRKRGEADNDGYSYPYPVHECGNWWWYVGYRNEYARDAPSDKDLPLSTCQSAALANVWLLDNFISLTVPA